MADQTTGRHNKADADLAHDVRHARGLGDKLEESEVCVTLLDACYDGETPADEALRRCDQELRDRGGDWMVEACALACSGGLHAMRGDFDRARELVDRSIAVCEEFNVINVYPIFERRDVEMLAGDFAAAAEWLRAADKNVFRLQ